MYSILLNNKACSSKNVFQRKRCTAKCHISIQNEIIRLPHHVTERSTQITTIFHRKRFQLSNNQSTSALAQHTELSRYSHEPKCYRNSIFTDRTFKAPHSFLHDVKPFTFPSQPNSFLQRCSQLTTFLSIRHSQSEQT